VRALIALVALVGCAKSLDQLDGFKCTSAGLCPTGFSCVDDQCHEARIDGPCRITGWADPCSTTTGAAFCLITNANEATGFCEPDCVASGCDTGRVCVTVAGALHSVCLPAPTPNCAVGFTGMQLASGMACVPAPLPKEDEPCADTILCGLNGGPASKCSYNRCVQPCATTSDCNMNGDVGRTCIDGGCLPSCSDVSPCASTSRCSAGVCLGTEHRPDGATCVHPYECESNMCVNGTFNTGSYAGCGSTCTTSCSPGFVCVEGQCLIDL
jgi:hypothetical protein